MFSSDFNIELKGYGKVAWSEGNHHHGLNYTAEEEYAETWHHFVQQIGIYAFTTLRMAWRVCWRTVGYRHLLQQGQHQYPFVLHLPPNIPSSYSGAHGKVEYPLKCCMKRSWNEHDLTCEVSLPVASHSDLNNPLEASVSTNSMKWLVHARLTLKSVHRHQGERASTKTRCSSGLAIFSQRSSSTRRCTCPARRYTWVLPSRTIAIRALKVRRLN